MHKLLLLLFAFGLFHVSLNAQCASVVNCPTDSITICDESSNNTSFWNQTYWYDSLYSSHNVSEGSVDLPLFVLDTCGTDSIIVSFVLFLDLDGDGVRETVVTSNDLPPAGNVSYGNAANPGYMGGNLRIFDAHPGADSAKYRFGLEQTASDDTLVARVRWFRGTGFQDTINPMLPPGNHRIEWRMEQHGIVSVCAYDFTVRDCGLPVVNCQPGRNVQLVPPGTIQLTLSDLLVDAADNYTPTDQLLFSLREDATGTGFPVDSAGNTLHSITFNCDQLGFHLLELWVKDKAGLVGICRMYVIVQDSAAVCAPPLPTVSEVCAKHFCSGQGIDEVTYAVQGGNPDFPPIPIFGNGATDSSGCVLLAAPQLTTATTTFFALKDDNPLNGVTTFDLVLISRHILGLQPLGSPYKVIAADANHSNSVTALDIIELRKLILGIYPKLPANTSWRFVNAGYVFPNPVNPFQTLFPEGRSWSEILTNTAPADFYGIKIGDVNCSVLPSVASPTEERSVATLLLPDMELPAGAVVDIPLRLAEAGAWLGWQGSLVFDAQKIDIQQIESTVLPSWTSDNSASLPGQINMSWSNSQPALLLPDEDLLTIRLRTLVPVRLRDALALTDAAKSALRPEAYTADENPVNLALQFVSSKPIGIEETTIFVPQPNPTTTSVRIPIRLAQSEMVTVEVTDLTGRILLRNSVWLDAGAQLLELPATTFPQAGLYGWRVQAGAVNRSGKVVKQ